MKFRHLFRIVSGEISLALPASNSFAQQNDPSDQPGLLADDSVELDPEFRRTRVTYRTTEPPAPSSSRPPRATYTDPESDLARIRAQIAAEAQRLEYYKLVAPMDGTVLKEDGEVGEILEPGTILYRIGLEKPLWVVAEVNEEDIPYVQVGQNALLHTDA